MSGGPYLSSEDSSLLRRSLGAESGGRFLEIGAGNAGGLVEASRRFGLAVGTDLARPGMEDWKGVAQYVLADAASCFHDEIFDVVAFNPPYISEEVGDDRTVQGGAELEVPLKFLKDALRVVRKSGKVVFLLGGDADIGMFEAECRRRGFNMSLVTKEGGFFEELRVYEASVQQSSR